MALPVFGPSVLLTQKNVNGPGSFYRSQDRYRQAKPIDRPLPYVGTFTSCTWGRLTGIGADYNGDANAALFKGAKMGLGVNSHTFMGLEYTIASAECYSWIKSAVLASSAELLMTFAERQKSVDMIATRGRQLWTFFTNLRTGNLAKARRNAMQFGWLKPGRPRRKPPPKKPRSPPSVEGKNKDAANLLLEVQFGWSPLVESVTNAIKVLSDPMPWTSYRASGKCPIDDDYFYKANPWSDQKSHTIGRVGVRAVGSCYIKNPNQYLANRMGLSNPALAMWDVIPFSFMFDWAVNVSAWLSSFDEFAGVELVNASYTVKYKASRTSLQRQDVGFSTMTTSQWTDNFVRVERILGIPPVKLHLKRSKLDFFKVRTIWALLVQRA